jgi:hypothetical protein
LIIRFLIRVDCEVASVGFCGVFEAHGEVEAEGDPGGVGVRNWTSSFEIILSGLYGTRPAPVKPPCMFFSVIDS